MNKHCLSPQLENSDFRWRVVSLMCMMIHNGNEIQSYSIVIVVLLVTQDWTSSKKYKHMHKKTQTLNLFANDHARLLTE